LLEITKWKCYIRCADTGCVGKKFSFYMKNMLLISGVVAGGKAGNLPSFRMVPTTADCPYLECQFEPRNGVLTVVLKDTVIDRQMVPRRNANGDPEQRQGSKKEENRWQMKESEQVINHIFHILYTNEVDDFIKRFAVNCDEYDWKRFIPDPELAVEPAPEDPSGDALTSASQVDEVANVSKIEIVQN
jgi:hypothetical protein